MVEPKYSLVSAGNKARFFSGWSCSVVWCGGGLLVWCFNPCRYCRTPTDVSFSLCVHVGGMDGIFKFSYWMEFTCISLFLPWAHIYPPRGQFMSRNHSCLVPLRHLRTQCSASSCCPKRRQLLQRPKGMCVLNQPCLVAQMLFGYQTGEVPLPPNADGN